MRVLLDECMPWELKRELPGHELRTVVEAGWGDTKNGALLRRAGGEFDVFLTVDSNLEFQQSRADLPMPVVVLVAQSNDINDQRPLMPQVPDLLPTNNQAHVYHVRPAEPGAASDSEPE